MMDGRNCTGRKISLLNDSSDVAAKVQLPPLTAHSRASSCASTPSLSPQTPQLSRSSSTSDSRGFTTPSPLTPAYTTFDSAAHHALSSAHPATHPSHHHHHQHSHSQQYYLSQPAYGKMDDQKQSLYPMPDPTGALASAYPMPTQMPQALPAQPPNPQAYRSSNSPASEPSLVSNVSGTSNSKPQPKKNQYPCPMAKQFNCNDYFTTSGHAARHAKKHTGKKDAFCPECNKAFTRKDNMEQHRRTHQNGRGASRVSNDDSKIKKSTKQPTKKVSLKPEPMLEAAVEQMAAQQNDVQTVAQAVAHAQAQQAAAQQQAAEQAMLINPAGPYFLGAVDTGPIPPLPNAMPDLSLRPSLHRSNFASSLDYVAPIAPMGDPESLHYSYPSPGLSNGLNSLALAASEHRRMSEEEKQGRSPSSDTTPQETP